jgi:hypothetical protein
MDIVGFAVVVALWVAFTSALVLSQSSIDDIWAWFKHQRLMVQISVGVLFLPWLLGMWIWESSWSPMTRGLLVGALAWANVYAFLPGKPVG